MFNAKLLCIAVPIFLALAGCQTPAALPPQSVGENLTVAGALIVSGSAFYRERIMTPPGAVLRVSVIDASIADKAAPELQRVEYPVGGRGGPFNYIIGLSANDLSASGWYMVRAVIVGPDQKLLWTSETANPVDPARKVQTIGPINLVMVAAPPADLAGTWHVASIGGVAMTGTTAPSMTFDGHGSVSGSTGCNSFSGMYSVSGQRIAFGPLAMTRRACIGDAASNERAFLDAIGKVTAFDAADSGGRRLIGSGDVVIMLAP